jgi:hypothetical protein
LSATVNGADVLSLQLSMPSSGAWVATLEADADDLAAGVAIADGDGNRFVGRKLRADAVSGRLSATVVAGNGELARLAKRLDARHFREMPLRIVLADILAQTGETLSPASDQAILSRHLRFWSFAADSPGAALRTLLERTGGGVWRVLADGTLWVGIDTFPAAPEFDREEVARDEALGIAVLAVDGFALRPGVTLDGRRVRSVEHRIAGGELRTSYSYG